MNILNSYKRTRFFLWVNITGLAIGLAASIMLILFVINELSYDRHFADSERIIRLNSVMEMNSDVKYFPTNLNTAYTELPAKVPGIEAATRIVPDGKIELTYETSHFQSLSRLYVDPDFFRIFQLKFVEGNPEKALEIPNSVVITRPYAEIIFGDAGRAINKTILVGDESCTVTAVVEKLPANTHFSFDILSAMSAMPDYYINSGGIDFYVYYRINNGASLPEVRAAIETEYTALLKPMQSRFGAKAYGITEKLTDIYLHSKATSGLGKSNDMRFILVLLTLALFILMLAIANFINLFMAQGETRMNEIAIRKTNGAGIGDIVRQFFAEVSGIVLIAFMLGFFLALIATPYFSELIQKDIELTQLLNPIFIGCMLVLFVLTITLSAAYPSFYLSRFIPLDILGKRLKFSKHRLTAAVVIFQSIVTIVLISYVLVIGRQTAYLENLPLNYDFEQVMSVFPDRTLDGNYSSLKQELLKTPGIQDVSGGDHSIGEKGSGQSIALLENRTNQLSINEYRIIPGLCELMRFQLEEGAFLKENQPEDSPQILINQATVKLLELQSPVTGQHVIYKGAEVEIAGVVKDFIYGEPADPIQPLVLSNCFRAESPGLVYIRFDKNIDRIAAQTLAQNVFRQFDSAFILNPRWSEDIYLKKFDSMKTQAELVSINCLLSVFIAMIGLLAIHLYTAVRRTKEIGIRRINGASPWEIFALLSGNIVKWIVLAGIIALPVAYYVASDWLNNYSNHTPLGWVVFVLPVLIQCLIAIITTSGVSLNVLSHNPVEALKSE